MEEKRKKGGKPELSEGQDLVCEGQRWWSLGTAPCSAPGPR